MSDSLSFLQALSLKQSAFPESSRYHGTETKSMNSESGNTIVYLSRRFLPQPDKFTVIQEHTVNEGERLDNIANQYLGDPGQFWKICDSNGAIRPDELTETTGNRIRITMPGELQLNDND